MRPIDYAMMLASACGLWGCDRAPEGEGNTAASAAPAVNAAAGSSDVDGYLSRFAAGDPDACFGDAALAGASFRKASETTSAAAPTRVIVAVDASGSMAGRVSGRSKLDLAQAAARTFVQGLPAEAEAGLLVFGEAGDNTPRGKGPSCAAIRLAVPIARDRAALVRGVTAIRAVGWTPLAAALRQAETLLVKGAGAGGQVIYVVSDGQETCGGDPVAAARAINRGATRAVVNIIGFAVPSSEAAALAAVASAGGGRFVNVDAGNEVEAAAARIRESGRQAANTLAESGATARNTLSASGVAAKARTCTGSIIARERIAIGSDIARKRIAGKDVTLEERAEKVLAERHSALDRRTLAFEQNLNARLASANRSVAEDAARAK
jgi:Ca-activated chloride channel family protein